MRLYRYFVIFMVLLIGSSRLVGQTSIDTVLACESYEWQNSVYYESGIYEHTFFNMAGGDSIVYLNLTIYHPIFRDTTISSCKSYTWNDSVYTLSGDYVQTFTTGHPCDSTVTLHLTILPQDSMIQTIHACESYEWNGTNYTQSGTYVHHVTNSYGCEDVYLLKLFIHHPESDTTQVTACENFLFNGHYYSESGLYPFTGTTQYGCDSTHILDLVIDHSTQAVTDTGVCESFEWRGETYTQSGTYYDTVYKTSGCTETYTLQLTIYPSYEDTLRTSACDSFSWRGTMYYQSGTYNHRETNSFGCEDTFTLQLTIHHAATTSSDVTACESYDYNGHHYLESGTYPQLGTTQHGCDSTHTLNLVIDHSTQDLLDTSVCSQFEWRGETYTQSGTYHDTVYKESGCIEAFTLQLTINHPSTDTLRASACGSYEWQGTTYTESTTEEFHYTNAGGCDSLFVLILEIHPITNDTLFVTQSEPYEWEGGRYSVSGTYTHLGVSQFGCDSNRTLVLTIITLDDNTTILYGCDSLLYNGIVYYHSDTIIELVYDPLLETEIYETTIIIINYSSSSDISITSSESYSCGDSLYTQSGIYTQTINNSAGCDSVVTIHLFIRPEPPHLFSEEGGDLILCNNIIANNLNALMDNIDTTIEYNIITSGTVDFVDQIFDFRPRNRFSLIVNHGNNDCVDFSTDLYGLTRIVDDTVDLGVYENTYYDYLLELPHLIIEEGGTLTFCNNVIANNANTLLDNIDTTLAYNIITSGMVDFVDQIFDFRPRDRFSILVNNGDNNCVDFSTDIEGLVRIVDDTVDLGVYENPYYDYEVTLPHLIIEEGGTLIFCNNVIANNANTLLDNIDTTLAYNIITSGTVDFVDQIFDFRPRGRFSVFLNSGDNYCVDFSTDLLGATRIVDDTVDLGVYENPYYDYELVLPHLFLEEGGNLTFCNNIIANNANTLLDNIDTTIAYNVITSGMVDFVDQIFDFRPRNRFSVFVNSGNNDCVDFSTDLYGYTRIVDDTVDLGVYENRYYYELVLPHLFIEDGGNLTFCNNIIANNANTLLDNIDTTIAYNVITSGTVDFVDQNFDYRPRDRFSVFVNSGDNDCVDFNTDLYGYTRIVDDTVDLGVYENRYYYEIDSVPVVFEEENGYLNLYNNIIINNITNGAICNITHIPSNNLVAPTAHVFTDSIFNFNLIELCEAQNTGENQYIQDVEFDIKGEERIACDYIVDKGAYEIQYEDIAEATFTTSYLEDIDCFTNLINLTVSGGDFYTWHHNGDTSSTILIDASIQYTYDVTVSNGGGCQLDGSYTFVPEENLFDSINLPSTFGKEFWVSFMDNYNGISTLKLIVSADSACTGEVINPNTGWSTTFQVAENGTTEVEIPANQGYVQSSESVGNFGLKVTTSKMVSLFASNFQNFSYDAVNILPTSALGSEYIVQTYTPFLKSEFLIVATDDNTIIEITPKAKTLGGRLANVPFTITLQEGETYQVQSFSGGNRGDLTGSSIKVMSAGKRIAVFNGNICASVSPGTSFCDHLFEQAFATKFWGNTFAVTSADLTSYNMVKVMGYRNNTEISINGIHTTTLNVGQSYEFSLSSATGGCLIETSLPSSVFLYLNGAMANPNRNGDPSMTWIAPFEQGIDDIIFSTFNSPQIAHHYINIVSADQDLSNIRLNGNSIGGQFLPFPGSDTLSYIRKEIPHGMHHLQSSGPFTAYIYGLGRNESYAYSAGSRVMPSTQQMLINGVLSSLAYTHFCVFEPILFEAEISYAYDSLKWDFGDGNLFSNLSEITHYYENSGTYPVDLTIYYSEDGFAHCFLLRANVYIHGNSNIAIDTTLCIGESYVDENFNFTATEPGYFSEQRNFTTDSLLSCDSIIVLHITVPTSRIVINDTICLNETYQANGFNITPTQIGLYQDSIIYDNQTICDSTVVLQLFVDEDIPDDLSISGAEHVCIDNEYYYSVPGTYSSYEWILPEGAQNMNSLNSDTIMVYFNELMTTDSIHVTVSNHCETKTIAIEITPHLNYYQVFEDTTCEGMYYDNHGFVIQSVVMGESTFSHFNESEYGCDSTTILNLVINPAIPPVSFYDTICQGDPYTNYGFDLSEDFTRTAGTLIDTLHLSSVLSGCDSIITLYLTISPVPDLSIEASDTTICLGEEDSLATTLTSNISITYGTILVGDILCTDGSIENRANFVATGKTAMGIVFYVDSSGRHGRAVALQDVCDDCIWGPFAYDSLYTDAEDVPSLNNIQTVDGARRDFNGLANTLAIKNDNEDNFNAYQAAYNAYYFNHQTGTVGTEHVGWYLPAIGELALFYANLSDVFSTVNFLTDNGVAAQSFNVALYWSSTEHSVLYVWDIFADGSVWTHTRKWVNAYSVRPVRMF